MALLSKLGVELTDVLGRLGLFSLLHGWRCGWETPLLSSQWQVCAGAGGVSLVLREANLAWTQPGKEHRSVPGARGSQTPAGPIFTLLY